MVEFAPTVPFPFLSTFSSTSASAGIPQVISRKLTTFAFSTSVVQDSSHPNPSTSAR